MTLGTRIRSLRLGYHWSARHGAWIRIAGGGDKPIRVDVAPEDKIPAVRGDREPHRVWWDDTTIIDGITLLKHVRRVNKPFSFIIDDSGDLVRCLR